MEVVIVVHIEEDRKISVDEINDVPLVSEAVFVRLDEGVLEIGIEKIDV